MQVWVEVGQVREGLHEQDQARPCAGGGCSVSVGQQARGDAAQLAQPRPAPAEDWAQEFGQREHLLPVRHRSEHVLLDPLAVQDRALLVAARAEIRRIA